LRCRSSKTEQVSAVNSGHNAMGQNATDKNHPGQNAIVLFCVGKMLKRSRILAKTQKCYRLLT